MWVHGPRHALAPPPPPGPPPAAAHLPGCAPVQRRGWRSGRACRGRPQRGPPPAGHAEGPQMLLFGCCMPRQRAQRGADDSTSPGVAVSEPGAHEQALRYRLCCIHRQVAASLSAPPAVRLARCLLAHLDRLLIGLLEQHEHCNRGREAQGMGAVEGGRRERLQNMFT